MTTNDNSGIAAAAGLGHNNPPDEEAVIRETIEDRNHAILSQVDKLLEASERVPTSIADDETAAKAGEFIKQVTAAQKTLEAARVAEKEPFLKRGRLVDGYFKKQDDKLVKAKKAANAPLESYLKAKEQEARRKAVEEAERLRKEAQQKLDLARLQEEADLKAQSDKSVDQAIVTEAQAVKQEQVAQAKPAELARTRTETGVVMTLRTEWVGELTDRAALDLEALRQHIPADALQKAIGSFVRAGGRDLKGARIWEKTESVVR